MRIKSNYSKILIWLSSALVVIFLLIVFAPNFLYVGVKTNLVQLAQPIQVLKLDIEFPGDWFPLASNESILGNILIAHSDIPTVIYYKNNWFNPWGSSLVSVSRYQNIKGSTVADDLLRQGNGKQFKWGYAIATSQKKSKDAIKVFLIPQYGLALATQDSDSLDAIQNISVNEK